MIAATIKFAPESWRVTEDLGLAFDGAGAHAWFFVEKTDMNTLDVAHALAEAAGVPRHEVGHAGRKDRHGITRQWFSVPTPCEGWPLTLPGVTCLETARHGRKLRIGAHRGNFFDLLVRTSAADQADAATVLRDTARGVPNSFGPQRTGGENWAQAVRWLSCMAAAAS